MKTSEDSAVVAEVVWFAVLSDFNFFLMGIQKMVLHVTGCVHPIQYSRHMFWWDVTRGPSPGAIWRRAFAALVQQSRLRLPHFLRRFYDSLYVTLMDHPIVVPTHLSLNTPLLCKYLKEHAPGRNGVMVWPRFCVACIDE